MKLLQCIPLNLKSEFCLFVCFQKEISGGGVVVNACFGCSSLVEGTLTVGRCILTVIFLFVALNKEPANTQRLVFMLCNLLSLMP